MGELLNAYLKRRDTIHHGWTPAGIAFGITAVVGQHWCIPGSQGKEEVACIGLHRGVDKESAIAAAPVGLALGKAAAVTNFTWRGHTPDTWYVYDPRPYNGAGVVGPGEREPLRVRTDGAGEIINPLLPNPPAFLSARSLAAGRSVLAVGYSSRGQGAKPTDLRVYGKNVDPLAPDISDIFDAGNRQTHEPSSSTEVAVTAGRHRYEFKMAPKTDGQWWIFAATFRNAGAVEAQSTKVSNVIRIDSGGANLIQGLSLA